MGVRNIAYRLEYATLAWNVLGIVVLGATAIAARSVALAGFGFDSLIEIGASLVVVWDLRDSAAPEVFGESPGVRKGRRRRALRLIGVAFAVLGLYLAVQSTVVLAVGFHPGTSPLGITWTALTVVVMLGLAAGKSRAGRVLANPVLRAEGRVTLVDGLLAAAVLLGLVLNATLGWWWADPLAGYVLVGYAALEVGPAFRHR